MVTFLDEAFHDFGGKGVGRPNLEDRNAFLQAKFRKDISNDGVADSSSDDSQDSLLLIVFDKIERGHGIELSRNFFEFHVELFMEDESEPRCGTPPLRVSLEIGLSIHFGYGIEENALLSMRDSHDRAEEDGDLIFF